MTRRLTKVLLLALACAGQTGCATLFNGTHQDVWVYSSPSGKPVRVDGVVVGVTPMPASLSRHGSHVVTVGDTAGETQTRSIGRRPSFWLFPELLIFWPFVAVDLLIGGGLAMTTTEIRVDLAPTVVAAAASTAVADTGVRTIVIVADVPAPPKTYMGMLPGHRVRFEQPDSNGVTEALLDSIVGDRVFLQTIWEQKKLTPPSIAIGEAKNLQVRRGPDRADYAGSTMHIGSQLAWIVPMVAMARIGAQDRGFRTGAIASAAVIPLAFVFGSASAPGRWAPLEAQRSGSPLLVDDRLRVRQVGSNGVVSGRLVDLDATSLTIRDGPETFRVLRTNVVSLERARGYDWRANALYGAAFGATMGFLSTSTCACRPSREDMFIVPLTSALIGLLAAPALAPRRWQQLTSW